MPAHTLYSVEHGFGSADFLVEIILYDYFLQPWSAHYLFLQGVQPGYRIGGDCGSHIIVRHFLGLDQDDSARPVNLGSLHAVDEGGHEDDKKGDHHIPEATLQRCHKVVEADATFGVRIGTLIECNNLLRFDKILVHVLSALRKHSSAPSITSNGSAICLIITPTYGIKLATNGSGPSSSSCCVVFKEKLQLSRLFFRQPPKLHTTPPRFDTMNRCLVVVNFVIMYYLARYFG